MDKERIKGTAKQVGGTVKEQFGKLTGNTSLEAEGKIEKAEGTLRKTFGKTKDALRKG
ncbi:CsbD family protein [Alkalilacustris brevis]|uniref:CsbD family protein n=1 Tax=Alkalilacustris brevis TaxID=2026338 RepID=UPI000E0D7A7F|nr:CsbD family protein [Alkalilacustris brevis]